MRHDHRPFDDVLQLTDVSGPVVLPQGLHDIVRHAPDILSQPAGKPFDEVIDKQRNVLCAEALSPALEPTSLRAKRLNGVHASSPRRWDRRRQDCRREDEYRRSDQRKRPWKLEFGNVITSQARQPPTHEAA